MMKRKILVLTTVVAIIAALTVLLSGCAGDADPTEGKNIVTFEINGGIFRYGTSSTTTNINYAYHPGTYIKDPTEFPNYEISRNGYNFTGWYTSPECKSEDKWDFSKIFNDEKLTLYAGWEIAIKYSYSVMYKDGDDTVTLGTYKVSAGDRFNDFNRFANKRKDHTPNGFFSDPECTIPWDSKTTHPGGASDLDVPVYVKYIEGDWIIVDNFDQLDSALGSGNVYLTADIDCEGEELYVSGSFNHIFEGNGHKISNFTVETKGTDYTPECAIFKKLANGAEIRNVTFEGARYNFTVNPLVPTEQLTPKATSLAVSIEEGVKISDVSITGTIKTNYEGDLPSLEKVFYYTNSEDEALLSGVTDFKAEITVANN